MREYAGSPEHHLRTAPEQQDSNITNGIDIRPDLLALTPGDFERLVRQLFKAIGMRSCATNVSTDSGVDLVAINPDPILGGLYIVQAKRYSNIVGPEAVRALAGIVKEKHANKGILVITSWVSKATRDFAARNGIEIIEGRRLRSILREHLGLDVRIGLPKPPPTGEHDNRS